MTADEPAAKRRKSMPDMAQFPTTGERTVSMPARMPTPMTAISETAPRVGGRMDVYPGGDALIAIKGVAELEERVVEIRCSSQVLRMVSPVFDKLFANAQCNSSDLAEYSISLAANEHQAASPEPDAFLLLMNVLHHRNDILPTCIQPEFLLRYIKVAAQYECLTAASRAASPWFDHVYNKKPTAVAFEMIEAAYILNDPTYFARFTTHWVLQQPLGQTLGTLASGAGQARIRLTAELLSRQKGAINALKADLDIIVDTCAEALSDDAKHYIDCAPGDEPHPDENREAVQCVVDKEGATEFLAALRDANIWPATKWVNTVEAIVNAVKKFRVPEYDASDQCYWCLHVEDKFATAVDLVRKMHEERLWGLCLDCYLAGGLKEGECRVEHAKAKTLSAGLVARRIVSGGSAASR
ncbi:hypothetical protein CLAFUW4_11271 [Fulvia fulva]|nr:hypothetical protein CLAFUR4_11277 [Fulvia fulva]KAK4620496.1 hypothetical protein CLAFUR0_11282 [Fulvia fulva]WPV17043.1 hypothetical protein CLAFUW4_11271 [Fulvia fulva]WPV31927.1 hypothetical protein CLAFUW7_11267 [Fulvia fulva]